MVMLIADLTLAIGYSRYVHMRSADDNSLKSDPKRQLGIPGSQDARPPRPSAPQAHPDPGEFNGWSGSEHDQIASEDILSASLVQSVDDRAQKDTTGVFKELDFGKFLQAARPDGPDTCTLVRVFYGTDRNLTAIAARGPSYDARRSTFRPLGYGHCTVSIPKTHQTGKLESPSILRLELRPNPERHIIFKQCQTLEEETFIEMVAESVSRSENRDAFVFVHGYNVSFEDAARRTGQIGFDLHFIGAPIFYSWPSNGKMADYLKDETNAAWSVPHFQHFLNLLVLRGGAKRVHVIAHSMGNRIVCEALKNISFDPTAQIRLNHLIMAAPDLDADTFRELALTLQKLSGRITLYESANDRALWASRKLHGNPRAGEPLLIIPGMDAIDASKIDTDFLGHSYFSDNWPLLSDIHSILCRDEPPTKRFGLTEVDHPDGKYYAFRS